MERRGRHWPGLLGGLVGLLHAGGTFAAEPCVPPLAQVVSVQGAVDIQRSGETRWQAAALGDPLCIGDVVRTGRVSRAALVFANDSVLRLDQRTELRLRRTADDERSLLDMIFGAIQFFSRRLRALEVDTPFVNAAAEGTEFFVRVGEEQARIIMFEGLVRASNPQGELLLAAGEAALVPEGAAPRPEIVVRPRDAVAWALYYPPILSALAERTPNLDALPMGLRRAVERVATNDYPGALEVLDAVPQVERDVRYWTHRAGVLLNVGRVEQAEAAIDRAFALDPDSAPALAQRAAIRIARQEDNQALADACRAVELEPDAAPARIALSYAHQARAELEPAREVLREGVERAPDDALLWARLAEIQLSFGHLDAAEDAAERATTLAPELGRTQLVRGFAELVRIDIEEAKAAFERAIALDSANPLARLGLGLARIRESDLDEGRREIEIAAGLDPSDALVRSYLGKAYFEERRAPLAGDQFQIAKELDPNDPTPYFYDAIRKQLDNRPVEALRDLERAIELNDNRAIYRSRLLLDQDLATRSVSLARIYDDLGFDQLALPTASESLALDPANWSAHRFLSDTYARLPRHEIARVSELLQSQLLQPININPVQPSLAVDDLNVVEGLGPAEGAFNEFHPLFARNDVQLTATGVAGNNDTFAGEGVVSAVYGPTSVSIGGLHSDTDGFRDNNDLENTVANAYGQVAVTPKLNLQAEYRSRETEQGDIVLNFDPDDFFEDSHREIEQDTARIGARFSPAPGSDLIASFAYSDRREELTQPLGPLAEVDVREDEEGYQVEGQYLLRRERFNVIPGFGVYDIDVDERSVFDFGPLPCLLPQGCDLEFSNDAEQQTGYIYGNLRLPRPVTWTLGLSYDHFEQGAYDLDKVNPKVGVQWQPTGGLRLRAAAFRTVKRALVVDQTIEPTQIAGFNQFFDDFNGSEAWRYGIGLDARLTDALYGGIEVSRRDVVVPSIVPGTPGVNTDQWDEHFVRAYLYWTPHRRWALTLEYQFDRFESEGENVNVDRPRRVDTHVVPLALHYFSPWGMFAELGTTVVHQDVDRRQMSDLAGGSDSFVVLDGAIGYRVPKRYGIISLEGRNLLDNEFNYQDDNYRTNDDRVARFIPDRRILLRATLSF